MPVNVGPFHNTSLINPAGRPVEIAAAHHHLHISFITGGFKLVIGRAVALRRGSNRKYQKNAFLPG